MNTYLDKFPTEKFYMIVTNQYVQIPGDERSRTTPGHGYPERTEIFPKLDCYKSIEQWENAVRVLTTKGASFRAFVVDPATVSVEVKVNTDALG